MRATIRRALFALLALAASVSASAQGFSTNAQRELSKALTNDGYFGVPRYTTALLPPCSVTLATGKLVFDTTAGTLKVCTGSAWAAAGGLTSPVSGDFVATGKWTFGSAADAANSVRLGETAGAIVFEGTGADAGEVTLTVADPGTSDFTVTLPASTTTLAGLAVAQTFTQIQTLSAANDALKLSGAGAYVDFSTGSGFNSIYFGGARGGRVAANTLQTPDTMAVHTGSLGNSVIFAEEADVSTDYALPLMVSPTLSFRAASTATDYHNVSAVGSAGRFVKTLTESAATSLIQIPVASAAAAGGILEYSIYAADASNQQLRQSSIRYAVINQAGTETCTLTAMDGAAANAETNDDNAAAISSGTLTYAITCSTSPTNAVDIQFNAVSSLTQTTLQARYQIRHVGAGEPLPQ